jgi:hypothetical protein
VVILVADFLVSSNFTSLILNKTIFFLAALFVIKNLNKKESVASEELERPMHLHNPLSVQLMPLILEKDKREGDLMPSPMSLPSGSQNLLLCA